MSAQVSSSYRRFNSELLWGTVSNARLRMSKLAIRAGVRQPMMPCFVLNVHWSRLCVPLRHACLNSDTPVSDVWAELLYSTDAYAGGISDWLHLPCDASELPRPMYIHCVYIADGHCTTRPLPSGCRSDAL